jgi:NADPH2:quinone reductase
MRAIQIKEFGGPEVMKLTDLPVPEPGDGELLVKVSHAGINFSDTHQRDNSYLAKFELPMVPGGEVAGVVERGSNGFAEGQRVLAVLRTGGYAEYAAASATNTFPIPDGVDDGVALALLIQGLTAWHLYRTSAKLEQGETVVVHGATGGVGNLAVQLAKPFGAGRVIATASTEEKRDRALELGADAALDPNDDELAEKLVEANGGEKVNVVLEMSGGQVFDQSLLALAPFGRLVTYGIASRHPNDIASGTLMRKSQAVIGFWLMHCLGREDMMREPLEDLFSRAGRGELTPLVGETYGLSTVGKAHDDLQSRRTSGKLLLDPSK